MSKIVAKSGEFIDATTSPVDKITLIALLQFTAHSLSRALGFLHSWFGRQKHITVFLMMHLGERKLSLLRKKNFYKLFRKKRFRFHVIKLIRCNSTCQRSITIIKKEKSFTPNDSPLSHYSLLIFCLKEALEEIYLNMSRLKKSFMKK